MLPLLWLRMEIVMIKKYFSICMAVIISLTALCGCYFLPDEEEVLEAPNVKASEVKYTTITAERSDLIKQIIYSGKIDSIKTTELSYENQGGKIKKIHVSAGDKVSSGDLICELDTGDLDYQIKDKELHIKKAKLEKQILKKNKAFQSEIDNAQVEVDILKNELEQLNEQLESSYLYAERSGTVSSVTSLSAGDEISAGEVVASIVDTGSLFIAIQPSNENMSRYKMNQKLKIKYKNKYYPARVYMTPNNIPEKSEQKFEANYVYIKFTGKKVPTNAIGNIADAIMVLDKAENVISIPSRLIKTVNGQNIVYILNENGEREAKEVEVGLETSTASEIKSGLKEGDKIVVR